MCGIAGVFGLGERETVQRMLQALVHRGPDDEYLVGNDDFALGARRLSIVDVSSGRQPIANETGTVWAAQNGEIYNFPHLRECLVRAGHVLRTHCDTELLPHLYEEAGSSFPEHIDGMFAVAVWDDARNIGLLARDRMGKKPLYYYRAGDALYFASEIKALLRVPGFTRRINFEALHHYLSYKHVPHPLSIFDGIEVLPPAHVLVFRKGKDLHVSRYWTLDYAPAGEQDASEDELVDTFLGLMRTAVQRRLMSDVPIGFFLSGGVDSSLTTALAAEVTSEPIKTFTLTYAHDSTSEGKEQDRRWARWVAKRYGTEAFEEQVAFTRFPDGIRDILRCFDEPFAGVVSTYFLSKLIGQHVKVAVSGDGADELFGSYLSHRLAVPLSNYPAYAAGGPSRLIAPFEARPEYLKALYEPQDWAWRSKLLVFSEAEKQNLYSPDAMSLTRNFDTTRQLQEVFASLTATDPLNRILEAEFRTIFPDQVLTFVDRLSMAHSLEVRSAFLDTSVVEFVARVPGSLKIRDGETKYLLKKAALRFFPEEMVRRKKEGFLMPVADWIKNDLEDYVRDVLHPRRLASHGLFDPLSVTDLVNRVYVGESDYMDVNRVLSLIVFQEWHDLYFGQLD
jgi:asparagine synthase (glutamine-hydrolysing)